MNASGESKEDIHVPAQEPQQQTAQEDLAARVGSLPVEVLQGNRRRRYPAGAKTKNGLDEARFTAGIVQFYEAVLKEPVPAKMLRLVEEIAKRERRS